MRTTSYQSEKEGIKMREWECARFLCFGRHQVLAEEVRKTYGRLVSCHVVSCHVSFSLHIQRHKKGFVFSAVVIHSLYLPGEESS
jgi:hypothetical protein